VPTASLAERYRQPEGNQAEKPGANVQSAQPDVGRGDIQVMPFH
jgi:hypothetical protein